MLLEPPPITDAFPDAKLREPPRIEACSVVAEFDCPPPPTKERPPDAIFEAPPIIED